MWAVQSSRAVAMVSVPRADGPAGGLPMQQQGLHLAFNPFLTARTGRVSARSSPQSSRESVSTRSGGDPFTQPSLQLAASLHSTPSSIDSSLLSGNSRVEYLSAACQNGLQESGCQQIGTIVTPIIHEDEVFGAIVTPAQVNNLVAGVNDESAPGPATTDGLNFVQRIAASALDMVEKTVVKHLENKFPLPSTADPRVQLEGNYSPVQERPVQHELEVIGKLPQCLEGVYVRNGANPQFMPAGGHHLFDGDGMLHAVRFKQGIASYACRYTRTHRLIEEERAGRAIFPKAIGELHGHGGVARLLLYLGRSLCGLVDGTQGMGVANAGLVFFNGRLLAMSEDDLPYEVRITDAGDLETVGRFSFDGQISSSMIAHPKIDPKTGELFALSYNIVIAPFLKYFTISPDGTKGPEVSISLKEPTMMHDFAITENYVVIPDQQVVFRMKEMLTGGSPVVYDKMKMARFGVMPRYDATETRMQWIDAPDCFCFHLWNSWEEGEEVVVLGSCMTPPDSIFNESEEALRSTLSEIRLNLRTGESRRRELVSLNLEAGQLNRNYLGRKSRYVYLAIAEPWPKVSGIAKVDVQNGEVRKHIYGPNCYGGEPFFVPRSSDPTAAEDDGFLLAFMHNEQSGQSELVVLDASSPNLEKVASVKLLSRVPYGFHGTYVSAGELAKQR